jgi:hypothetical protein
LLSSVLVEGSLEYTGAETRWTDHYGTGLSDGYRAYMFELSGLFELPFSGRVIRAYIGGGGGLYAGERTVRIASAVAGTTDSWPVFGIHVLFGAEWQVLPWLSLRGDARFRDPQISVENRFSQSSISANGVVYPLPTEAFPGDININGNVYSVGVVYRF